MRIRSSKDGRVLHECNGALARADLRGLDLRDANFWAVSPVGADFSGALLHTANFVDADLTDAIFVGANMNNADLRDAALSGANLFDAILEDAKLDSAEYDARTIFPKSFDPARHGMTMRMEKTET